MICKEKFEGNQCELQSGHEGPHKTHLPRKGLADRVHYWRGGSVAPERVKRRYKKSFKKTGRRWHRDGWDIEDAAIRCRSEHQITLLRCQLPTGHEGPHLAFFMECGEKRFSTQQLNWMSGK